MILAFTGVIDSRAGTDPRVTPPVGVTDPRPVPNLAVTLLNPASETD